MSLTLAPLELHHLETIHYWRLSPKNRAHLRETRFPSYDDSLAWYKGLHGDDSRRYMAIQDAERQLVGVGGFVQIDWVNQNAEMSVLCEPTDLEPEAVQLLLYYGFETLNLHRIWVETYTEARGALFLESGFTPEGMRRDAIRRGGEWRSSRLLSILADDWP